MDLLGLLFLFLFLLEADDSLFHTIFFSFFLVLMLLPLLLLLLSNNLQKFVYEMDYSLSMLLENSRHFVETN